MVHSYFIYHMLHALNFYYLFAERQITPNALPAVCMHCGSNKMKSVQSANKCIIVTMRGTCLNYVF